MLDGTDTEHFCDHRSFIVCSNLQGNWVHAKKYHYYVLKPEVCIFLCKFCHISKTLCLFHRRVKILLPLTEFSVVNFFVYCSMIGRQ